MLSISDAQEKILKSVNPIREEETLPLLELNNRIIAQDIISMFDIPPADNSAMDGYAINLNDLPEQEEIKLEISQRIPAGSIPAELEVGTAARIFTGAEIPKNANAVVIQENTQQTDDGSTVILKKIPSHFENIRAAGQDVKSGESVINSGTRIDSRHIGMIAAIGLSNVTVKKRVKVAVFSTGNELLQPGEPVQKGKIFNSNLYMIQSLLKNLDCEIIASNTIPDNFESTKSTFKNASKNADVVISIGGVSVGEEDHVKKAVEEVGEIHLWKIKMKPGKPLAFGKIENAHFIGLPGNPVSSFVSFLMIAAPVLKKIQGDITPIPSSIKLPVLFSVDKPTSRAEFIRVSIRNEGVERFSNQSSGVLKSVVKSDGLALIEPNMKLNKGDLVDVFPFDSLLS